MNTAVGTEASRRSDLVKPVHGIVALIAAACLCEVILGVVTGDTGIVSSISRAAIVFLTLYTLHRYSRLSLRRYRPSLKDLLTFCSLLVGSAVVISIGNVLALSLSQSFASWDFGGDISASTLLFAIPFASGALLIQAVLGIHFGLMFSLSMGVIVAVYFPSTPLLSLLCLVSCLVACLSLVKFRTRSAYLKAGMNIGLVSLPFAIASAVIDPTASFQDLMVRSGAVFFGGILCAFVSAGLTPVLEHIGGYVTDMRLLEMATLDHPLLKELSIQAPGTWNHSMVIGMMVETAADAIGANPVLARVAAYFHDIGKMKKPLYFVENQGGENRHEKLSTSMSALIIRSHVKDGIELAKKHRLPEPLVDMIPQHHGTSVIDFFYKKARSEAEEAGEDPDEVDVSLYSYPGPKPQTREAGILMLADGIEAAARTISEPTQDRIQGMVQKLINKIFASGQLNECELTLQDLHHIAKSFTRVLTSIHHQRIAYAEPAEKINEKKTEDTPDSEKAENEKKKSSSDKKAADKGGKVKELRSEAKSPEGEEEKREDNEKLASGSDAEQSESGKDDTADNTEDLKRLGLQ